MREKINCSRMKKTLPLLRLAALDLQDASANAAHRERASRGAHPRSLRGRRGPGRPGLRRVPQA